LFSHSRRKTKGKHSLNSLFAPEIIPIAIEQDAGLPGGRPAQGEARRKGGQGDQVAGRGRH